MAENDPDVPEEETGPPPHWGDWPDEVGGPILSLRDLAGQDIRGRDRLGDLAFDSASEMVDQIMTDLTGDLVQEPWNDLPTSVQIQIRNSIAELTTTLESMLALRSSDPDAANKKTQLEAQLNAQTHALNEIRRAYALRAKTNDALLASQANGGVHEDFAVVQEALREATTELAAARKRTEELDTTVEAARATASTSAAEDLSEFYRKRAEEHATSWRRWLWALVAAVGVTLGGGVAILLGTYPGSEASTAEIARSLAIDFLVVALLVYGVRLTAGQFRAHRHLQTVDRNKEMALRTFSRLVATPSESEVRGQLAVILAQSVFKSDESVFADSSGDQVTVIERLVGALPSRPSP